MVTRLIDRRGRVRQCGGPVGAPGQAPAQPKAAGA